MKTHPRFCIVLLLLLFAVCAAHAQDSGLADRIRHTKLGTQKEKADRVPYVRMAPLFGRGGAAFSQAGYLEVNPAPWFGAGLIVGRSGVNGYADQGAMTDVNDFSSGVVLIGRYPKAIKHIRFGAFVQSVYNGSHLRSTYTDEFSDGNGGVVDVQGVYRASDRNPVTTAGVNLEYYIPHGPTILVRVGKNFGDGLAVNTAGGTYVVAGPLVDPVPFLRSSGQTMWRFIHH